MTRQEKITYEKDQAKKSVEMCSRLHLAVVYKYLHAIGFRIDDCDRIIRQELEEAEKIEKNIPW